MAELSYQEIYDAFAAERPTYVELIDWVGKKVRKRLKAERIYAQISGRAKEADSFAAKALIGDRYSDPLNQIGDKAGLRVVVTYLRDVDRVETLIREEVRVIDREQKLDALAYNEAGYLGVHLDCRLHDEDAEKECDFKDLRFEVQLRTTSQGAWAQVAHEQLYKPPTDVPDELKRRIYRLVSLVELFDYEVDAFLVEAEATPGYQEAVALEPLGLIMLQRFGVTRRPNRRLSLLVMAALAPILGEDPAQLAGETVKWAEDNADRLQGVFDAAGAEVNSPLLSQPEILLVLRLLEIDPDGAAEAWPAELPPEWLQDAARVWGVRLFDEESQAEPEDGD